MPSTDLEITQKAMDDFVKIQRHMLIAEKENAVRACVGDPSSMIVAGNRRVEK